MYVVNHFSPAAFKILFLAFDNLFIISLSMHLFEFISSLKIHDFLHIWKVLSHYYFKYFLLLFLFLFSFWTPIMHLLVHLMVSHRPLRLCSFYFIFFYCSSDLIISIALSLSSLILSSASLNLLLSPYSVCFHCSYFVFAPLKKILTRRYVLLIFRMRGRVKEKERNIDV